ncbi:MAG: hypothetical protein ABFE13_18795 [Phycisphaerales bacterium]
MWGLIGRAVLRVVGVFLGQRSWNGLFLWLLGQAPRIWGGKYAAGVHGRRSRDWLYRQWVAEQEDALRTKQLWDDNGVEWIDGFLLFGVEEGVVIGQIEQAVTEITNGDTATARKRLVECLRAMKLPSEER